MLHWSCLHPNVTGCVINEEVARWLTDGKLVQGVLFVEIVLYNDVNPYVCQPVRFAVVEFECGTEGVSRDCQPLLDTNAHLRTNTVIGVLW